MSNGSPFQEIEITSFDEFEHTYSDIRKNHRHYETVSRGQAEAVWGLVPSAFREFSGDEISVESFKDQIRREFLDVSYFVKIADVLGFDLPGDLLELLNPIKFNISKDESFYNWYNTTKNGWKELITIAQHYGVKTRYLDFTFNPYTALFFAALEVTKKYLDKIPTIPESSNHFSLWVLDKDYLNNSGCTLDHFEVPTARNKYLNAQKGLFLSPPLPHIYEPEFYSRRIEMVNKKSLDILEVIRENNYHLVNNGDIELQKRWPIIYKFNFPFQIAPKVIQELDDNHKINMATQKPNLENIIPYRQFREKLDEQVSELKDKKVNPDKRP
ncbi:MAG: hypothetical protein A3J42_02410 [Candidatus Dadabacteria bacterium RIFCSPHIGHO2_12_FULL_53_21]|nr:MAG: hypothetical protein A3J42_02410 [Candidatus Dadabacteria bacterium RIFCSPHIGHO2_12_FULL_53_21]